MEIADIIRINISADAELTEPPAEIRKGDNIRPVALSEIGATAPACALRTANLKRSLMTLQDIVGALRDEAQALHPSGETVSQLGDTLKTLCRASAALPRADWPRGA